MMSKRQLYLLAFTGGRRFITSATNPQSARDEIFPCAREQFSSVQQVHTGPKPKDSK